MAGKTAPMIGPKTPQQVLDAMLDEFAKANDTATAKPGQALRQLIESTPALKFEVLKAIRNGHLEHFANLDDPSDPHPPLGTYNAYSKTLSVSGNQLVNSTSYVDLANQMRFTLGHEVRHAHNHDGIVASDQAFERAVNRIASSSSRSHDYTAAIDTFLTARREAESRAEIAGFNIVAARVLQNNPKAGLGDLYNACPDDMRSYITEDKTRNPPTYTLKAGLGPLDAGLRLPDNHSNREAMGRLFFDARGYPEELVQFAVDTISQREAIAQAQAKARNPKAAAPAVNIDLASLGVSASSISLPAGMSGTALPRRSADNAAPAPNDPAHPDSAYFNFLRERLPNSVPDNAVAQAMLAAKQDGMNTVATLDPNRIGLVEGRIWVFGQTPGVRVSTEVAQAPSMDVVAEKLDQHLATQAAQQQAVQQTLQPNPGLSR